MANTLNVGNGDWATKENSLLGYNSENGNYKPLPFDFTRASNGTFVNKAGLIETAANGVPRIDFLGNTKGALLLEPQRTNLITYSSDFSNSYWSKSGASIKGDPSTAGSELVTNGDFATDSDWVKQAGWSISGGTANCDGSQNLPESVYQNGVTVVGKTYKITYTLVSITSGTIRPLAGTLGGAFQSTIGTHTEYLTATSNTAIQIQASSSFIGSIDNVSVKEVQGFSSPSGDTNAFKLVEDSANSQHYLQRNFTSTNGSSYTYKIYVKMNGRRNISLRENGSTGYYVSFDLLNGVILEQSNATGTIKELTNGWFEITHTSVAGNSFNVAYYLLSDSYTSGNPQTSPYQGDGVSGFYIYGAQLEQGSYATSLINTQGSAVTRVQDVCNNGGNDQVINSTEGVLYAEMRGLGSDLTAKSVLINDLSSVNEVGFYYYGNRIDAYVKVGGANEFFVIKSIADATITSKIALLYKENDFALWVNGVKEAVSTSGLVPIGLKSLNFTQGLSTNQVKLYNTALTDAELAALTTI